MDFKQYRPNGIMLKEDEKLTQLAEQLFELIEVSCEFLTFNKLGIENKTYKKVEHLFIGMTKNF